MTALLSVPVLQPYPFWELAVVCSCQLVLIAFNFVFLFLSFANTFKRRQEQRLAQPQRPAQAQGQPGSMATISAAPGVAVAAAGKPHGLEGQTRVRLQAKVL
jgi:hypothetical protein